MDHSTAKSLTASILGCKPFELINFRPFEGGAIALNPRGQKFTITRAQLEKTLAGLEVNEDAPSFAHLGSAAAPQELRLTVRASTHTKRRHSTASQDPQIAKAGKP